MDGLNYGGIFPNAEYLVVLAFIIIGAGLKFIDAVFDDHTFNKKFAFVIAPILVLLWLWISATEPASAIILFSILFAVLLSGKVDNLVFKASAFVLVIFFFMSLPLNTLWLPLIVLITLGMMDEAGNDYVDRKKTNKLVEFFFLHRFSMKFGIMVLCMSSYFQLINLIAFLAFDLAYDSVGMLSSFISSSTPSSLKIKTSVFVCKDSPFTAFGESLAFYKKGPNLVPSSKIVVL